MNRKICAVIVTYNRKQYLEKLVDKLLEEEYISGIFIFDNHGKDNTREYLETIGFQKLAEESRIYDTSIEGKKMYFYRNSRNTGGAGGFSKAVEFAMRYEWDYLWIMDDDVCPEDDCLEKLLDGMNETYQVCIPNRTDDRYTDNAAVRYSLHNPFKMRMKNRVKSIPCPEISGKYVDVQAFPFEGPLISTKVIRKVGYPAVEYFIFYDDSDYCQRCLQYTKVRMVLGATLHKQIIPTTTGEVSWRTYYIYRNCFYFDHKYCKNFLARNFRPFLICHSLMLLSFMKRDHLKYHILRTAYCDAKTGKMGKTILQECWEDYVKKWTGIK